MVPNEITWSRLALKTYMLNIEYLEQNWTKREVNNFIVSTQRKLQLLIRFPDIGSLSGQRPALRKTLIGKRILLFYRYRPQKKQIELVRFFNTYQQP